MSGRKPLPCLAGPTRGGDESNHVVFYFERGIPPELTAALKAIMLTRRQAKAPKKTKPSATHCQRCGCANGTCDPRRCRWFVCPCHAQ